MAERLTSDTIYTFKNKVDDIENDYIIKCQEKLKLYEDLEEQNLLIKLPCEIGDTVYVKMLLGGYAVGEVRDYTHTINSGFGIVISSPNFNKMHIPFTEFGNTIFLTKEEAKEKCGE